MKRCISKLILVFSQVILLSYTLAQPPEGVLNQLIAHRHRLRDARLLSRTSANLRSGTAILHDSDSEDVQRASTVSTSNWAGAVQVSPPSGTFNSVSAQWTLPTVSPPPSDMGTGEWYSAEWVGIDGYSCTSAILQAGTYSWVQVSTSGDVTTGALAWYEWLPNALTPFSGFTVNAGDTVAVSITAQSSSSGTVVINNLSTGQSTSINLSPPTSSNTLCGMNAEWVLEDASSGGGLVPFSSFTDVYFSNCAATTTMGDAVDLTGSTMLELVQNNAVLATPVLLSPTELEVSYG